MSADFEHVAVILHDCGPGMPGLRPLCFAGSLIPASC
jgi:hypothetical protein